MTIKSTDYALLAKDSYNDPDLDPKKREITLDGVKYKIVDHEDKPTTGFQATAYQRVDTGEVVIAFRGTEFDREPVHDGVVDVGMALAGVNAQAADADAFTERVMEKAKADAQKNNQPLNVTVTGHSLGGTLAQLEAHKLGLKGETFNAFGAAGLVHGVPKGGHQVINHVRAGDAVSAASAHFGEVRVYAVQQDINTLGKAGYRDDGSIVSVRNPAKATDFSAHRVDNFVPNSETLGRSIISRENEARYDAHHSMIDRYRDDVHSARVTLSASTPLRSGVQAGQTVVAGAKAVGHAAGQAYDATSTAVVSGAKTVSHAAETTGKAIVSGAQAAGRAAERTYDATSTAVVSGAKTVVHAAERTGKAVVSGAQAASQAAERTYDAAREQVITGAQRAERTLEETGQKIHEGASRAMDKLTRPWLHSQTEAAPLLNQPGHPGNRLYKQALAGLEKINAERSIPSDQRTCNAAGTLAASACESRFRQIDHVVLNDNGSKLIAVQGPPGAALSKVIGVDTTAALNTPLAQSSQAFAEAHNLQQNQQFQQVNRPVLAQTGPVLA
ncbi:XVIPCD domain-containing protein [Variovorax sp. DXTD-1]|uniref:XVIPCD domain-containing protein n=1 Tax=Variovorax sp. DXTD-1 TaxID=2495592 RepID=UPI000F86553F|nr:XVIPCD domain-containing protein [Variovorax sp. DXTD-1]RST54960.1 DUF2974 domain-containing protein [Variovorax sp. DXTD-1]